MLELKRQGVPIDAIAVRDRPEDVAAFLARHGDPFDRIGADPESRVQLALGSSGVPETFIVDGRGIIRYQHMGPIEPGDRADDHARMGGREVKRALLPSWHCLPHRRWPTATCPPRAGPMSNCPTRARKPQAKALMEELRCLVCQGQSIADSNAELAGDMRAMVRQRIAAGEEPEQVRAWLIERYGNWVSYRPPVEPATWPLWAAPFLLLAVGAWLLRKRLVRRRG